MREPNRKAEISLDNHRFFDHWFKSIIPVTNKHALRAKSSQFFGIVLKFSTRMLWNVVLVYVSRPLDRPAVVPWSKYGIRASYFGRETGDATVKQLRTLKDLGSNLGHFCVLVNFTKYAG